jgi:hypothetical protein
MTEKYRGWTVIKNNDGYIALDPQGNNVIPGAACHTDVAQACKSIDYFILAKGDVHIFHLLWGHAGWDALATDNTTVNSDCTVMRMGKRDNRQYKPSFEYLFTGRIDEYGAIFSRLAKDVGFAELPGLYNAEQCLALSNLLRRAAEALLEK